jgi:hypothetical protein
VTRGSRRGWPALATLLLLAVSVTAEGIPADLRDHGPLPCGALAFAGDEAAAGAAVVTEGGLHDLTPALIDHPCGGPMVATLTIELGGRAPSGAEGRVTVTAFCTGLAVTPTPDHPPCLVGSLTPLRPSPITIPLPFGLGPVEVGLVAYTFTFVTTLPPGRYVIGGQVEPLGGDMDVQAELLSVVAGGARPVSAARPSLPVLSPADLPGSALAPASRR